MEKGFPEVSYYSKAPLASVTSSTLRLGEGSSRSQRHMIFPSPSEGTKRTTVQTIQGHCSPGQPS